MQYLKVLPSALIAASLLAACSGNTNDPADHSASVARQIEVAQKTGANLSVTDYAQVTQALYVAYFGRPADPAGLANVETTLLEAKAPVDIAGLSAAYSSNPTVKTLVDSFASSAESVALYGNSSTVQFVTSAYNNLLNRVPAAAGLSYWANAIDNNGLNRSAAALAIFAGSQSNDSAQGLIDAQTTANKLAWAEYFTTQLAVQNSADSYAGADAASLIRFYIGTVSASAGGAQMAEQVEVAISDLQGNLIPTSTTLNSVAWTGNQFVAVGSGSIVETSPDGITWTNRGSALTAPMSGANLSAVVSQYGRLIAVGTNGGLEQCVSNGTQICPDLVTASSDVILTSSDGINWSNSLNTGNGFTPALGSELSSIIWTGGQFVAVGDTTSIITSSPKLAIGSYGNVLTSVDGLNWSPQTTVTSNTVPAAANFNKLDAVVWSGTQYVALGVSGGIYTSPTGTSWTQQISPSTSTFKGLAWSGSTFVAVGQGGAILNSPDGVSWHAVPPGFAPTALDLNAVTWSGTQFVAVGSATVVTSPDGINWTLRTAGTLNTINSVTWSGTQFVAVGNGIILSSPDGIIWTSRNMP